MSLGKSILLLSDNNGDEYVSRIETAVTRQARILGTHARAENIFRTRRAARDCVADETIGGVILTAGIADDRPLLSLLEQRRMPFVRIAPLLDLERGSTVSMDEYEAARAIADLLLKNGHRRVGFVRGPRVHLVSIRRFNGYASALGGRGLKVDPDLIVEGDFSRESGRTLAPRLFAARPTAIFASNDEMALGVIDAAIAARIAVPKDLSIVGFDDNSAAQTSRPPLTSLRQPLEEMGETACSILVERMRRSGQAPAREVVPFRIVERQSVAELVA